MINIATFSEACESIRKSAESKCDEEVLHVLRSVNYDLIAAEGRYHKACHASYVSKTNLKYQGSYSKEETKHSKAFNELLTIITPEVKSGKAYDMNTLLTKYKELLQRKQVDGEGYTRQKLKSRLQSHFGDSLVFQQPFVRTEPEFVYSSSLSLFGVINAVYRLSSSEPQAMIETKATDKPPPNNLTQMIYAVSKAIRNENKSPATMCG